MSTLFHVGDAHFSERVRLADNLAAWAAIAEHAKRVRPSLIVQAGDLFDAVPNAREREAAYACLVKLAGTASVVVCRGNHDPLGEIELLNRLEAPHRIFGIEKPQVVVAGGFAVAVLPHFDKRHAQAVLPAELGIAAQNQAVEDQVRALLLYFRGRFADLGLPSVLVGHPLITGSTLSSGETAPDKGITLSVGDLETSGADYIALGHIHKAQAFSPTVRYAGSTVRTDFGEAAEDKTFCVVTFSEGTRSGVSWPGSIQVEPVLLPSRPMLKIEVEYDAGEWYYRQAGGQWEELGPAEAPTWPTCEAGAEVWVRIVAPEERSVEVALLEASLRLGQPDARLSVKVEPTNRVRAEAIATAKTPAEKLEVYWSATARPPDATAAGALDKLATLLEDVK